MGSATSQRSPHPNEALDSHIGVPSCEPRFTQHLILPQAPRTPPSSPAGASGWRLRLAPLALVGALALATFSAGGVSASPKSAPSTSHAAPHIRISTRTETLPLSAADCAALRKVDTQATCTLQHTVTETDITPSSSGATPDVIGGGGGGGGCYVGDKIFNDSTFYVNGFWMYMRTEFSWDGSCGRPANVGTWPTNCYVTSLPTGIIYQSETCLYTHPSQYDTEGYHHFTWTVLKVGGTYGATIYRDCDSTSYCWYSHS